MTNHYEQQGKQLATMPNATRPVKKNKTSSAATCTNPSSPALPHLPKEVWGLILNFRTMGMCIAYFKNKCLPEIRKIEYYIVELCNHKNKLEHHKASIMIYKGRKVTRRGVQPSIQGEPNCLHVRSNWWEIRFQSRFNKSCDIWLIDANPVGHSWLSEAHKELGEPEVRRAVMVRWANFEISEICMQHDLHML